MIDARGVTGMMMSLVASVVLLATATDGFRAFTTDTARARSIAASPVPLAPVALRDQDDAPADLSDDQRSTILDFVYTRCLTVCSELSGTFQQLQAQIRARGLTDRVRLLSVSFDPAWDTPARLRSYGMLMHADPQIWTLSTVRNTGDLSGLLQSFGVRVVADGNNGFVHNAALHVVSPQGRLVAILPLDATESAMTTALAYADSAAVSAGPRRAPRPFANTARP